MIDGVKIKCIGTTANDWLNNPMLVFCSKVDTTTGEILAKNKVAFYRGLSFHIVPSTIANIEHLFIRGSLATFYNNGKNNAFDYDVTMLAQAIKELENRFNINPNTAIIQAFEFGANINPVQSNKAIIKGLRAYQSYNFSGLKMDNVFNGLQLKRQNTNFKIYDKGIQTAKPETNTLRIEYALHFNKVAKKYGFEVLADFLNVDNLNAIKPLLLEVWANAIFYDKGINWRNMSQKDKEKMLYYLDATNWDKFTKMQRKRAKDNFKALHAKYCTSTTQADVLELLTRKLDKLTAVNSYQLQNFSDQENEQMTALKMLPFTTLDKLVNSNQSEYPNTSKNTKQNKVEKSPKNSIKKCCVCGSDISNKKPIAVYCSKHCNNSNQATKRKMIRHEQNKVETPNLNQLIKTIPTGKIWLNITYKANGTTYTDRLHQSEVNAPPNWIKQVISIQATTRKNGKAITLTDTRAKQLIRILTKYNQQNGTN